MVDGGVHTMTSSETPRAGDSVLAACGVGRRKITRAAVGGRGSGVSMKGQRGGAGVGLPLLPLSPAVISRTQEVTTCRYRRCGGHS